jgi:hypothetical protein
MTCSAIGADPDRGAEFSANAQVRPPCRSGRPAGRPPDVVRRSWSSRRRRRTARPPRPSGPCCRARRRAAVPRPLGRRPREHHLPGPRRLHRAFSTSATPPVIAATDRVRHRRAGGAAHDPGRRKRRTRALSPDGVASEAERYRPGALPDTQVRVLCRRITHGRRVAFSRKHNVGPPNHVSGSPRRHVTRRTRPCPA